jgi:hypothetical protein
MPFVVSFVAPLALRRQVSMMRARVEGIPLGKPETNDAGAVGLV